MNKIILLLCISLVITNCKDGGDGSSTHNSGVTIKMPNDFIPNEASELGGIAQAMLAADSTLYDYFHAVNAGDGQKAHGDIVLFWAIRGYIQARAKAVDGNGELDVLNEDPIDAFNEAILNPNGSTRGVSRQGLCYLTADVLESFGQDVSVVTLNGTPHTDHAPDGTYCVVEVHFENGDVMYDSYMNHSWSALDPNYASGPLSTREMAEIILSEGFEFSYGINLIPSPDGQGNPHLQFGGINDYLHAHKKPDALNNSIQFEEMFNVLRGNLDNYTYIHYSELR